MSFPAVLKRFGFDRRANFAMIFGLTLLPLLGLAGLATDFAKATLVKRRLDLSIDAASLAALNKTVGLINEGKTSEAQAVKTGEEEGRIYFAAQAAPFVDSALDAPIVKVTRDGSTLLSRATYGTNVPTVFARLFGKDSYAIGGRSEATVTLPPFYDVHVLVDISASMGIGATPADQDILYNMPVVVDGKTKRYDCTIACHIVQPGYQETSYTTGRRMGATMRIDVIRDALKKVAQNLLTHPTKRYRLAIHTMHTQTTTLVPLTNDLATANSAIDKLNIAEVYGGTNFHVALKKLATAIKTPGNGEMQDNAKAALVFMTDGVENDQTEQPGSSKITADPRFVYFDPRFRDIGGTVQSLDPTLCTPFKAREIRVIAMNTKYIVPSKPYNVKFEAIRNWLHVYIDSNMRKCVSSNLDYHDASSPADIEKATSDILNSISKPIALTR